MRVNKGGFEKIKRRIAREPAIRQFAIDQGIKGSVLLYPPETPADKEAFKKDSSIYLTSKGEYYTALRPVPGWLHRFIKPG